MLPNQVSIEYLALRTLILFFFHSTVRIWNTENPKKNKTVIKTKNKQGRKINVKKEAVSDIKFFLLENWAELNTYSVPCWPQGI